MATSTRTRRTARTASPDEAVTPPTDAAPAPAAKKAAGKTTAPAASKTAAAKAPARRAAAAAPAAPAAPVASPAPAEPAAEAPATPRAKAPARKAAKPATAPTAPTGRRAPRAAAAAASEAPITTPAPVATEAAAPAAAEPAPTTRRAKAPSRKTAARPAAPAPTPAEPSAAPPSEAATPAPAKKARKTATPATATATAKTAAQAPAKTAARKTARAKAAPAVAAEAADAVVAAAAEAAAVAPAVVEPAAAPVEAVQAPAAAEVPVEAPAAAATADEAEAETETEGLDDAATAAEAAAPAERGSSRQRARRRRGRGERAAPAAPTEAEVESAEPAEAGDSGTTAPLEDTAQAVLAVLTAAPAPAAAAEPQPAERATATAQAPEQAAPAARRERERKRERDRQRAPRAEAAAAPAAPTGPAHSAVTVTGGDLNRIAWQPGHACPPALREAAARRLDEDGFLPPGDDGALPTLLRLAAEAHHPLSVDDAVWTLLAAHRDARTRAAVLEAAYPDGPASAGLQPLLRLPLPLYQAEGALFAVVAGRALIADERGLGKGVQAIAAAALWRRHFGVRRVLLLCAPAQRAGWLRAWQRFAAAPGDAAAPRLRVVEGGLHQRQAQWSADAEVRILSPEALESDAAHVAHWAPELVIVDEPQQLALDAAAWARLDAPHALVLCGAPLADEPALMETLVAWLDRERLGPLAALRALMAAGQSGRWLNEAEVERLTDQLSRLMLQRQRADVLDQLPPVVHSERLLAPAPGQREAHDRALALARRLLDGWQRSGYLSDSDQWRLAQAVRTMQAAAHRADPADPGSALADASVQALLTQLADWAGTGGARAAVLCPRAEDRDALAARLAAYLPSGHDSDAERPVLVQLLVPGEPLPGTVDAVVQFGVPWRPRRSPSGARGEAVAGQQWVYLVAEDSLDAGLFDTLALRWDVPRGPGEGRDYLAGARLAEWLQALQAALAAVPAVPA